MAEKNNNDCVFCKIVRGEIPCDKIYETKDVLAFLDINPYSKGHILLIPKKHSRWIWDMPLEEYNKIMKEAYYLANILRTAFSTDWVEQAIAGIGVEHTHIHLLPRQFNDGLGEIPTKPLFPKPSKEEKDKIYKQIKKYLR